MNSRLGRLIQDFREFLEVNEMEDELDFFDTASLEDALHFDTKMYDNQYLNGDYCEGE